MTKRVWVQIDGKLIDKSCLHDLSPSAPRLTIIPDLPSFVSPIDGSLVSGRKGLREHCLKHDVVPTADLAGLPPKQMNQPYVPDRAAIRETLKRVFDRNQSYD